MVFNVPSINKSKNSAPKIIAMNLIFLLSQTFIQHALIATALISIACGIIGVLVMTNRLVFMAGGIAHTAYGGVGLAFFSKWPVLPTTGIFTGFSAILLGWLSRKREERTDTLIGVLWAAGMAIGVILIDLTPGYGVNLMSYLFGSILTISTSTLWLMTSIDIVIVLLISYYFRDLLSTSFDPEFAKTRGIPVTGLRLMLLVLIAETVVMMLQAVGLILVMALLTIPPYIAERHTKKLVSQMIAAMIWGLLFCIGGLIMSFYFNINSGPAIVAIACACYLILAGLQNIISHFSSRT